MRRIQLAVALTLAATMPLAACKAKHDDASAKAEAKPVTCPPGNAVKDGACVQVITPEKVTAVAAQKSKVDDLATLLDQVSTVAAPVEMLDNLRKLDQWQALKSSFEKLAVVDTVADQLQGAIKTLHTFQGDLKAASGRLGNLQTELNLLLTTSGASQQLDELRTKISGEVRGALDPLAAQVQDAIQHALVPLTTQLTKVSLAVIGSCAMSQLSGSSSDQLKTLCAGAQEAFGKAAVFLEQVKTRPAVLFNELSGQLGTQLDQLIDSQTKQLISEAQARVNHALDLPAAGSGSGH